MQLRNVFNRMIVKLLRIKPIVRSAEEKARIREELIAKNRKQDKDITSCKEKLIKGLTIKQIKLDNSNAWLITKDANPKDKIIYYIHGGGFIGACTKERMRFVSYLVKEFGYNVFSIDYRLAPEFMYPCALNDCFSGYKFLLSNYDSKNIVVVGESAGGTLSLSLAMMIRDKDLPQPKSVHTNSLASQLVDYTDSYKKYSLKDDFIITIGIIDDLKNIYFDEEDAKLPYISPLFGNLANLPPIYLTASSSECLYDDSKMLYEKLKESGNETTFDAYDDLCHAFIVSPQMRKVRKTAYVDLRKYFENQFSNK